MPVDSGHKLKPGAIGLVGVLFIAVANAAPITAMTGNTPIAIGYGNGIGAPGRLPGRDHRADAVRHRVRRDGAPRHHGRRVLRLHHPGSRPGVGHGLRALATMAYVVFEGSLIGIFAYFTNDALDTWFGSDVNWLLIAVIGIVRDRPLRLLRHQHRRRLPRRHPRSPRCSCSARWRSRCSSAAAGPTAWCPRRSTRSTPSSHSPRAAACSVVGLDGDGRRRRQRRDRPVLRVLVVGRLRDHRGLRRGVAQPEAASCPAATLIAVVGLGIFYTFVSWMMIAGNGAKESIEKADTDSDRPVGRPARQKLGGDFVGDIYLFLIVIGSFACALAFHTAASRYLYAIGREIPRTQNNLGATHSTHGTPHIASLVQIGDHARADARLLLLDDRWQRRRPGGLHLPVRPAGDPRARWRSSSCRRSPRSR